MKKLLSLLGAIGMVATTSATVVACGDPKTEDNSDNSDGDNETYTIAETFGINENVDIANLAIDGYEGLNDANTIKTGIPVFTLWSSYFEDLEVHDAAKNNARNDVSRFIETNIHNGEQGLEGKVLFGDTDITNDQIQEMTSLSKGDSCDFDIHYEFKIDEGGVEAMDAAHPGATYLKASSINFHLTGKYTLN